MRIGGVLTFNMVNLITRLSHHMTTVIVTASDVMIANLQIKRSRYLLLISMIMHQKFSSGYNMAS